MIKKFIRDVSFYGTHFIYKYLHGKSRVLMGLLPTPIIIQKRRDGKSFIVIGDKKCSTEKLEDIDVKTWMMKFGFFKCVKERDYSWAESIFDMDKYLFFMVNVYRESDLPKLQMVYDLINSRIKDLKKPK